jgi:chromate transport protein ChrA
MKRNKTDFYILCLLALGAPMLVFFDFAIWIPYFINNSGMVGVVIAYLLVVLTGVYIVMLLRVLSKYFKKSKRGKG